MASLHTNLSVHINPILLSSELMNSFNMSASRLPGGGGERGEEGLCFVKNGRGRPWRGGHEPADGRWDERTKVDFRLSLSLSLSPGGVSDGGSQ